MRYKPCSGQRSRVGAADWGICLADYEADPSWRLRNDQGAQVRFPTYESALARCTEIEAKESDASARLIAAAPALLAALELLTSFVQEQRDKRLPGDWVMRQADIDNAKAAIAAATGKE